MALTTRVRAVLDLRDAAVELRETPMPRDMAVHELREDHPGTDGGNGITDREGPTPLRAVTA